MRTTIDIDAVVLRDLKRLQEQESRTLGSLASELLAQALQARKSAPQKRRKHRFRTFAMGRPLVDLEDKVAVQALLDAEDRSP